MYRPNSVWTWAFVVIAVVQAAIVLAFEGYVFSVWRNGIKSEATDKPDNRTIPTYLVLFVFGFVYELVLVWDALRMQNTIQIIGICIYNLGLLVYSAVQKDQISESVVRLTIEGDVLPKSDPNSDIWSHSRPFLVAVPCIVALGTVLLSFVAWKLYDEFAWSIYKHISADLRMKRRYLTYQIYIALLKFDFFFFLGFTVQFVVIVLPIISRSKDHADTRRDPEFGATIAAIPVTIIILVLAAFFTRRENRLGMISIICLYFAALGYFIFKLVRIYAPKSRDLYSPAAKSLTTFSAITVILIVVTIVNAIACTVNFNKGLKPHVASQKKPVNDDEKVIMTEMPSYSHQQPPQASRMTID